VEVSESFSSVLFLALTLLPSISVRCKNASSGLDFDLIVKFKSLLPFSWLCFES
jgi:hypothetical protein